jgi:ribonuclease HII
MRYIIGIDEAGRGPLAGPVSVGIVMITEGFNKKFFKGVRDSKQLTPEDRDLWFALVTEAKKKGELDFRVALVSEKIIDKKGIAHAIRLGIKRCLKRIDAPAEAQVFLDGGIRAPKEFIHQTTIIRGDEKVPVISLASICAKVVRDRRMVSLSKIYPEYAFEIHKGYGTRAHREAIQKYGPSLIHRLSFVH